MFLFFSWGFSSALLTYLLISLSLIETKVIIVTRVCYDGSSSKAFPIAIALMLQFVFVLILLNYCQANVLDIEEYFRKNSASDAGATSNSLKLVFSRDIDYVGLKSSEPLYFDTTLNQVMTNYNDSNVETLFRLYFPYGVNQVLKAFKLYPTIYVQYGKNYSHVNYMPNVTDFLSQSAKFDVKLYKSCRLFSQIDNIDIFNNSTCYTSGLGNYQKIANFLMFYYSNYASSSSSSVVQSANMSQVLYNLRRLLISINDMSDAVKSLSFPCHVIGFNSSETNPSNPDFLTPSLSDLEHLLFSRKDVPFKITPNYASPMWWSNLYETSLFIADDLSTTTGFVVDTTNATNLNEQVLQFAGLSETLFMSKQYDISSINWTDTKLILSSTKIQTLCSNTIKALVDKNNNNLFSSYYQSKTFNNSRPIYLLEPTSVWISVDMKVPFYAKVSDTVYPHFNNSQFSTSMLNESVFVTVRFPVWNPNYNIISQHQNVYDTNDYLFDKIVSLFDCNTLFLNYNGLFYSPFYLSPKYREYLSQFISLVDWTNFYKMNWGYFQTWSNYDKTIYDERGFDYCYKNISPFNLGKQTGVGARGLYSYIDSVLVNVPSISCRTYGINYDGSSNLVNFTNLIPDLYHPTFVLYNTYTTPEPMSAPTVMIPSPIVNLPVPYNIPSPSQTPEPQQVGPSPKTTNSATTWTTTSPIVVPSPSPSSISKTPSPMVSPKTTTDIIELPTISPGNIFNDSIDYIDEDVLGHYNLSNTSSSNSGTGSSTSGSSFFDRFAIGPGINNVWSIVLIVLSVVIVCLVGLVLRYRTKKNADAIFSDYDDETFDVNYKTSGHQWYNNRNCFGCPTWFNQLKFKCIACFNRDYGDIVVLDNIKTKKQLSEKTKSDDEYDENDSRDELVRTFTENQKKKDLEAKKIIVYEENNSTNNTVRELSDDMATDDDTESNIENDQEDYITIRDGDEDLSDTGERRKKHDPLVLESTPLNILDNNPKEKHD